MNKKGVLFLCTGNSCRSQMAEGWAKHLCADSLEAYSAGTTPQALNQLAVRVMCEVGIDISNHNSKRVSDLSRQSFDTTVTVCDSAARNCPVPPHSTKIIHAPFDDPPALAKGAKNEEEALAHYRRVRDEIGAFVRNTFSQ